MNNLPETIQNTIDMFNQMDQIDRLSKIKDNILRGDGYQYVDDLINAIDARLIVLKNNK